MVVRRPVEDEVIRRIIASARALQVANSQQHMQVLERDIALRRQRSGATDAEIEILVAAALGLTVMAVRESLLICSIMLMADECYA